MPGCGPAIVLNVSTSCSTTGLSVSSSARLGDRGKKVREDIKKVCIKKLDEVAMGVFLS
jgi:hypothetical protein